MNRTAFIVLLAIGIAAGATRVMAFGVGREGLSIGKLGASPAQGSNGVAPVGCGSGVIDLSAGCTLPIALGLVP